MLYTIVTARYFAHPGGGNIPTSSLMVVTVSSKMTEDWSILDPSSFFDLFGTVSLKICCNCVYIYTHTHKSHIIMCTH